MTMAKPKVEQYHVIDQRIGRCARLLGYPARIAILRMLHDHGPTEFSRIVQRLPISNGSVSEHLRILHLANLVSLEERGLVNAYSLNPHDLHQLFAVIHAFSDAMSSQESALLILTNILSGNGAMHRGKWVTYQE
jgi:ArsR family transcriptional regulator, arsenate/arsenite/antimonite-responsive transcriptional repressor